MFLSSLEIFNYTMSSSSFKIVGELKEFIEQCIVDWIRLHYDNVKEIQQVRNETPSEYRRLHFRNPVDSYRELIELLFHFYNESVVEYIIKQNILNDSHKIPILQYVIEYYKINYNTRYVDDILNWKKFNNISYLTRHLIRVYVREVFAEEMIFQIFEDLDNNVVVLK